MTQTKIDPELQATIGNLPEMTQPNQSELREQLAAIEHERWADWQKWCHKVLRENNPSPEQGDILERWDRQIATPYAELSEKEKQSDRDQVDRYWQLVEAYLAQEKAKWVAEVGRTVIGAKPDRLQPLDLGELGGENGRRRKINMRFLLVLSVFVWVLALVAVVIALLALIPAAIAWGILYLCGINVRFVLDDRDRVVKMWREQGLKVLQVAEGDF